MSRSYEAERSFELREPRLGEIDATLQVLKLFFQIDGHRGMIRRFMPANQQAARQPRWDLVAAAMHHVAGGPSRVGL